MTAFLGADLVLDHDAGSAGAGVLDHGALDDVTTVDPSAPALVAYTSGTTSDPKGVVHAHRTIGAEIRQLGNIQPFAGLETHGKPVELTVAPPMITGAPVGHGIGMLAALLLPVYGRRAIHLIDVWDPKRVLAATSRPSETEPLF